MVLCTAVSVAVLAEDRMDEVALLILSFSLNEQYTVVDGNLGGMVAVGKC